MVDGRTARRSHSRKKGQVASSLRRTPKASGVDGAHPVVVPEVAGGPARRVDLDDLPPQQRRLHGQRGQESVDGRRCARCS